MVELIDDATAFARALQRFGPLEDGQSADWVDELLQQAADFVNERATPDQAKSLFRAIMRRGDQIAAITDESEDRMKLDPIHWVVSVLLDCLLRIDVPAQRLEVLRASVGEDAGLLTAAELLDLLDYRVDIFATGDEAPTAEANSAKLRKVLKILEHRIKKANQRGELKKDPQYKKIVKKWRQLDRRNGEQDPFASKSKNSKQKLE